MIDKASSFEIYETIKIDYMVITIYNILIWINQYWKILLALDRFWFSGYLCHLFQSPSTSSLDRWAGILGQKHLGMWIHLSRNWTGREFASLKHKTMDYTLLTCCTKLSRFSWFFFKMRNLENVDNETRFFT